VETQDRKITGDEKRRPGNRRRNLQTKPEGHILFTTRLSKAYSVLEVTENGLH